MIALLSDIHANAVALDAVLADMASLEISTALCLGDTIGYGPDPVRCVALVREHCVASVMGNHEAMSFVLDEFSGSDLEDTVNAPLRLAHRELSTDDLDWIKNLPIAIDLDAFEVVHASLQDPAGFFYIDSPEEAAQNFKAQKHPVSFHGHTHFPAIWEKSESGKILCLTPDATRPVVLDADRTYAINVGSVGQPRDGDPRSSYAAYDHSTGTLIFRRVEYDLAKAGRRFQGRGLPAFNRTRLRKGR